MSRLDDLQWTESLWELSAVAGPRVQDSFCWLPTQALSSMNNEFPLHETQEHFALPELSCIPHATVLRPPVDNVCRT